MSESTVKLFSSTRDRERYEVMADLYSIFIAMEYLEKAYIKDTVSHDEYTQACTRLIAQYKTIMNALGSEFVVHKFIEEYEIRCPAAKYRLIDVGVPATTEHTAVSDGNVTKYVAETVQHFITLLDALKLNLVAIDQIHPLMSDLMRSLSQIKILPPSFDGKTKMLEWLKKLNRLRAADELSVEDARQLSFDLETALADFHRALAA